jgi:uncharacterized YccA/Bax inhibitor family protein
MQSNNPVFSRTEAFSASRAGLDAATSKPDQLEDLYAAPSATPVQTGRMTYDDVVVKTGITFVLLLVGAVIGWQLPQLFWIGMTVGLVLGLVNAFKREPSPALILAYAAFEGVFLGSVSFMFENMQINGNSLEGIVAQAVLATLAVFGVSLWAYRSRRIRVTPKFQRGLLIAMGGYLVFVLVNFLFQVFGSSDSPFGFRTGPFGILVGLFAVGLAALLLVLDFADIENGVRNGLPARYAWQAAFGLVVTLVWLYIELLQLLAILRGE